MSRGAARASRTLSLEASVKSTSISVSGDLFTEYNLSILVFTNNSSIFLGSFFCFWIDILFNTCSSLEIVALFEVEDGIMRVN